MINLFFINPRRLPSTRLIDRDHHYCEDYHDHNPRPPDNDYYNDHDNPHPTDNYHDYG